MSDEKLATHQPSESLDQAFENHFKLSDTREKSLLQALHQHEQKFQWTPLWFETYETLMLQISYFPQLSSKVDRTGEFIRQQIVSANILTFNEFLRLLGAPIIVNLLEGFTPMKTDWQNICSISRNSDDDSTSPGPPKINWENLKLSKNELIQEKKIQAFNQLNLLSRTGIKIKI